MPICHTPGRLWTLTCSYCHSLATQFTIDFVSILPFWLVTLDFVDPMGSNLSADAEAKSSGGAARASVLIRIVKLMRMLKLARVFKASRVMQRVLMDIVMVCSPRP